MAEAEVHNALFAAEKSAGTRAPCPQVAFCAPVLLERRPSSSAWPRTRFPFLAPVLPPPSAVDGDLRSGKDATSTARHEQKLGRHTFERLKSEDVIHRAPMNIRYAA